MPDVAHALGDSAGDVSPMPGPRRRRRLLVVTYFFPPVGGVGVQRTLKAVRHLARLGWDSVVVTPHDPAYPLRDPSLLDQVLPGTRVVRTRAPEPIGLPARIRGRAAGPAGPTTPSTSTGSAGSRAPARRAARSTARGLARTVARRLIGWWVRAWRTVLFPDDQMLWIPFAVRAGRRAHRESPLDVILSSSPPVSAHLAAMDIARATRRPWIADFRDPWVGNAFAPAAPDRELAREARTERRIVTTADRVIVASPAMARDFAARYPERAERIAYIPNGYDRDDVAGIVPWPREPGRFTLVYAGSVYGDHELRLFLEGVERLVRRRPEVRSRLTVEFVGRLNVASERAAAEFAAPDRLGSLVTYLGFRPRAEAIARMLSADALLQIVADEPGKGVFVGTKLLEAIGLDRRILAILPPGDARTILDELDWGVVVDPVPDAVANGLERLLESPAPDRRADPEGRYDRAKIAERLAAVLDELAPVPSRH